MDDRKLRILAAVVDEYVTTGEPVGSKTIAALPDINVSSATIRNDMAVLEQLGLLEQPHTSAGRVPTFQGYKLYIEKCMPGGGLPEDALLFVKGLVRRAAVRGKGNDPAAELLHQGQDRHGVFLEHIHHGIRCNLQQGRAGAGGDDGSGSRVGAQRGDLAEESAGAQIGQPLFLLGAVIDEYLYLAGKHLVERVARFSFAEDNRILRECFHCHI